MHFAHGKAKQGVYALHCTARQPSYSPQPWQVVLDPVIANLASPLARRLRHNVDLLIFNPPYVLTDDEEAYGAQLGADLEGSWAGGKDGMHVTDVLLTQLDVRLLTADSNLSILIGSAGPVVPEWQILSCRHKAERRVRHSAEGVGATWDSEQGKFCEFLNDS